MNENNTNVIVTENNDYNDTKGEKISKLLWWLLGVTAARLIFSFYESTGGNVPVPNMGNQAIYWIFSAVSAVILIMLGKYGKFYKISGILTAASCVMPLIMPFTRGWFSNPNINADSDNFLDMLNGLTQAGPIYKMLNRLNPYLILAAFIFAFIAHKTFSKPLDEKIAKWWNIVLILYIVADVPYTIWQTVLLYIGPAAGEQDFKHIFSEFLYNLSKISLYVKQVFEVVLIFLMAKKSKAHFTTTE